MSWNLGDTLDAVAATVPRDRQAIVQGDHVITWGEMDERTNRLARAMIAAGLKPGDRVAFLSRNHPGYLEGFVACFKARLVHVNINYRYRPDEIAYIFKDCDVRGVLFQNEFAPVVAQLQSGFPNICLAMCTDSSEPPQGSVDFETLARTGDSSPLKITRSDEDGLMLYTGGTTGMPKGVVWPAWAYRQCQLESPLIKNPPATIAEHIENVRSNPSPGRVIPACPLMHGAGMSSSLGELLNGGTVILLPSHSFNALELWQIAAQRQATRILIVGDVFARPMLNALDDIPDLSSLENLKVISSAGLIWSNENKQEILRKLPWLALADLFGASEASGLGYSVTTATQSVPTGRFSAGPKTVLITEDDKILGPGEPGEGLIARSDPLPSGYFGDAKKTAEVFRTINGVRYSIPGDWARRDEDGFMQLIGRGNLVINTGGEKVFVEEVEEALKLVPGIEDALVVGVPNERWGSIVVALVRSSQAAQLDLAATNKALSASLAAYKQPKSMFRLDALPRSDAGKADYKTARALAAELVAKQAS